MRAALLRTVRSLGTLPGAVGWWESALVSLVAVTLIGLIAVTSGMLAFRLRLDPLLVSVFLVPAFTEELIFRGPMPGPGETRLPLLWLAGGVVAFMLWHIVEALTFLPGASLFLTPAFLLCAGVLGAACAVIRYRTGSLWPAVALHGVVVLLWQALFGGPSAAELMQA